jgi:hypothetical protein
MATMTKQSTAYRQNQMSLKFPGQCRFGISMRDLNVANPKFGPDFSENFNDACAYRKGPAFCLKDLACWQQEGLSLMIASVTRYVAMLP